MALRIGLISLCFLVLPVCAVAQPASQAPTADLVDAFSSLSRDTEWQLVQTQPINFDTYHPQGFAKVGDVLFVSSVEIIERTRRYATSQQGMDRSTGKGKGHLFKIDLQGNLLAHIENRQR